MSISAGLVLIDFTQNMVNVNFEAMFKMALMSEMFCTISQQRG